MTEDEILKYYQTVDTDCNCCEDVEKDNGGSSWTDWVATAILIPIAMVVLLALLTGLVIAAPILLFRQFIYPAQKRKIAKYWKSKGVELIVGYDKTDPESKQIADLLKEKYDSKLALYDWSETRKTSLEDLSKKYKDSKYIPVFMFGRDINEVVHPPFGNEDPCKVYVVKIDAKNKEFYLAASYPMLDDLELPTEVIRDKEIFLANILAE